MEEVRLGRYVRKYLPLLLALAIGVTVSVAVFFVFFFQDQARLRTDFNAMAADRAQALRFALAEDQVELGLVSDYVSASSELSRGEIGSFVQEFGRLARRITTHEEDLQVIAFIVPVDAADRASFEALMRKSVDGAYAVRDIAPNGILRPARDRAQY